MAKQDEKDHGEFFFTHITSINDLREKVSQELSLHIRWEVHDAIACDTLLTTRNSTGKYTIFSEE